MAETESENIVKSSSDAYNLGKVTYSSSSSISNFMIRAVRSRIPKLISTRGSDHYLVDHNSHSSSRSSSSWSTLVGTPSPIYRSNISLCESEDELDSSDDLRELSSALSNQEIVPSNLLNSFSEKAETECGIKWKFANQGLSQIFLSAQESRALANDSKRGIPSLTRQLYLHGALYLLRGLPDDLSNEEIVSLWAACRDHMCDIAVLEADKRASEKQLERTQNQSVVANGQAKQPPSTVHRLVSAVILQMFLLAQFLAPFVSHFLALAYRFERRHRISEHMLKSGIRTVDQAVKIGDSVCRMNNGKVGNALQDFLIWWMNGVVSGIQEGLEKGLDVFGLEVTKQGQIEQRER